jgi:hypothetical protein
MILLLFIAGLILLLAGSGWFAGAATVGLVLVIVAGFVILMQLLMLLGVTVAGTSRRNRW